MQRIIYILQLLPYTFGKRKIGICLNFTKIKDKPCVGFYLAYIWPRSYHVRSWYQRLQTWKSGNVSSKPERIIWRLFYLLRYWRIVLRSRCPPEKFRSRREPLFKSNSYSRHLRSSAFICINWIKLKNLCLNSKIHQGHFFDNNRIFLIMLTVFAAWILFSKQGLFCT